MRAIAVIATTFGLASFGDGAPAQSAGCDRACLQDFADTYRAAYLAHDAARVAIDARCSRSGTIASPRSSRTLSSRRTR